MHSVAAPDVTTIVVTHNNAEIIDRCLLAVRSAAVRHTQRIVVVDNASWDGTPERVAQVAPEADLIALKHNVGFAAGNNIGRQRASSRFLALVNSDCFPDPGAIDLLVDAALSRPDAGLVGGRLRYEDGRPQSSAGQQPTLVSVLWLAVGMHRLPLTERFGIGMQYPPRLCDRSRAVGWVSGAFCLARREIGPLPELGFMYGEDVEWAAQVHDLGYECWVEPRATAVHLGGASVARMSAAGFTERRSVEALIRWFARRGRAQVVLIRVILCIHALLRLAGATAIWLLDRRAGRAAICRFWAMLGAALRSPAATKSRGRPPAA